MQGTFVPHTLNYTIETHLLLPYYISCLWKSMTSVSLGIPTYKLGWQRNTFNLLSVTFITSLLLLYVSVKITKISPLEVASILKFPCINEFLILSTTYFCVPSFFIQFLLILWVRVLEISEFITQIINLLVRVSINLIINKLWVFKQMQILIGGY